MTTFVCVSYLLKQHICCKLIRYYIVDSVGISKYKYNNTNPEHNSINGCGSVQGRCHSFIEPSNLCVCVWVCVCGCECVGVSVWV